MRVRCASPLPGILLKVTVLFVFLTMIFVCASGLLWWQLSRAQEMNAQLLTEVNKLRGRLRALRQ